MWCSSVVLGFTAIENEQETGTFRISTGALRSQAVSYRMSRPVRQQKTRRGPVGTEDGGTDMHVRGEFPPDPASGILGVEGVWRFAAPAVDASVPQARHAVRDLLKAQGMAGAPQYDELLQGVLLIVSELVTNAVRHAALLSPQIVVEVVIGSGWLRLSVEDSHPYRPRAPHSDEVESCRTGGRGLLLVKAVAAEAGGGYDVERTATGGKVVWASVPLPRRAPAPEHTSVPGPSL
jgi:anti-sigma regulatory factor (Ser/Thr protein kinase)